MTTTVSSGAKEAPPSLEDEESEVGIEAKRSLASAARKVVEFAGRELRSALWRAEAMDCAAMSMPIVWVKVAERAMVKKPEPQ